MAAATKCSPRAANHWDQNIAHKRVSAPRFGDGNQSATALVSVGRRGRIVRNWLRWLLSLSLMIVVLGGCTRNRPTPAPTAIVTLPAEPVSAPAAGSDPAVEQATEAPAEETPAASETPSAEPTTETFTYRVTQGDTLFSIASKFETDVDTVRQLNFLIDDNIVVGQILQVPYKPGMTEAGAPTPTPEPFRYTVATGDTLSSIAQQFGVTTVSIIEANGLLDPNAVQVGQEIIIPGYQPSATTGNPTAPAAVTTPGAPAVAAPATTPSGVIHVVQPGEGLIEIAEAYGIDEADLAQANNITNRNLLRVGQELIIPGVTPLEAARIQGSVHVVEAGESLLNIASRYGVTVDAILELNSITDPNSIFVGQELVIPKP
jgi:LysM repeat protein